MSKKYLSKNEFRMDLNPAHFGKENKPHPSYITVKHKNKFKANAITHSRRAGNLVTYDIGENPDKQRKKYDNRVSRISEPYWQTDKLFSKNKLNYFRYSNFSRKKIRNINKKLK